MPRVQHLFFLHTIQDANLPTGLLGSEAPYRVCQQVQSGLGVDDNGLGAAHDGAGPARGPQECESDTAMA